MGYFSAMMGLAAFIYIMYASMIGFFGFGPVETLQDREANLWRGSMACSLLALVALVAMFYLKGGL